MAKQLARADVVTTVIYCGNQLLLVRNADWGFTLPMTKLRSTQLGIDRAGTLWELGEDAAMRNVADCFQMTSAQSPNLLLDVGGVRQSSRTGDIQFYQFHVYGFDLGYLDLPTGVVGEWRNSDEILDPGRRPISSTARLLVRRLKEVALDRGGSFPPLAPVELRKSVASIAIIHREQQKQRQWLCRWNENWQRYFLVGGHQEDSETANACMVRELQEELGFMPGADYALSGPQPLASYIGWSIGYWQQTQYTMSPYIITPTKAGHAKIGSNAANRWLTWDEIASERCADDKLVSPTTRKILHMLNR
jgi:8-oxo-dGTP pyrophosphatase MutT (NUDIX family)